MAVTIKKIAELAGVSRGTVDRALNHRGGVDTDVEKLIKMIAKKLDYKPNVMAKALANSNKNVTIGVLLNSGGNHFFDKVLAGIETASHEIRGFGIKVIIKQLTGYDINQQLEAIDELVKSEVNGLIITPINDKLISQKLNSAIEDGIHVITLNSDVAGVKKLAFVGCNYDMSGQTAAELLGQITQGSAKVGIITGSNKMLGHTKRVNGFCKVIDYCYEDMQVIEICEGFDNDIRAYSVTKKLLEDNTSITALYFCAGGIDGGIKAVNELNLAQKLKIITVDDTDNIKEYLKCGVVNATVCQQPFKQGYDSIKIVFDMLLENKTPNRKQMFTQNEIKVKYNID